MNDLSHRMAELARDLMAAGHSLHHLDLGGGLGIPYDIPKTFDYGPGLIEAYRESISSLDWMTETTRERALDKLAMFTPKIGYPDTWRDYSAVVVTPGPSSGAARSRTSPPRPSRPARSGWTSSGTS